MDSTATNEISSLDLSIIPTPNGTTMSNSTVVDVATSNVSGYNLYMNSNYEDSSNNKTTALINTDPTVAVSIPTSVPSSASATNYWNYASSWNETISGTALSGSTGAKVIPTYNTPDLLRNDVEDPAESSQTTVAISVNVDNDIPAGTYRNKLVFTAIANPIPVDYTLTFDKNTTDTVNNLPSPITATSVATSYNFTIPDVSGSGTLPAMTRAGYSLVGWSESPSARQGSGSGPDGLYVAGDTYTVIADDPSQPDYSQHGTGASTLYAVWEVAWASTAISVPGTYLATGAVNPNRQVTIVTTLDSGVSASDLGAIGVTLGSSACTSPTLGTQDNKITITCTAPDLLSGDYTVSVTSSKNTGTLTITNGYHVIDALVDFQKLRYNIRLVQTGADNIIASVGHSSVFTCARGRAAEGYGAVSNVAGYSDLGNNQAQYVRTNPDFFPSAGCYDIGYVTSKDVNTRCNGPSVHWLGGQYVCYDGTNITLHAL